VFKLEVHVILVHTEISITILIQMGILVQAATVNKVSDKEL